jgi:hypothetical protein
VTDRELSEWVAGASVGDAIPTGMSNADVFERLAAMGAPLEPGRTVADLVPVAQRWAKEQLWNMPIRKRFPHD